MDILNNKNIILKRETILCYGWTFNINNTCPFFQKIVELFHLNIDNKDEEYVESFEFFQNISQQLIDLFDVFRKYNKTKSIVKYNGVGNNPLLIFYPILCDENCIFNPNFQIFEKDEIFQKIETTTNVKPSFFIIEKEN